ncbi:putative DNA modification/repair radical SAM protein [Parasphingorhabdus halotolerans]|uniref:Putative DNA modification/repair radical SAM protein n=1 Tax=Parasphingorhabdus halotolerans TaxID=2725558 RepID=A0A6H2DPH8_9SPHN|nr:putative DNA modification/repair radical SAM protein [Parasphingorhabdus halotolerans]QJB70290.1 putative DNA modification/repair radical SAM protein [Parasphingorhabdus halotolerans]
MSKLTRAEKLAILADAAKYDASCASSGSTRRNSLKSGGIGSTSGMGICHSYAPDGRCISLLKILMTNYCMFDCLYCVNRTSSNVRRAAFTVKEIVDLTLDFYKRNYIEGLFLSSGIIRSPDYTMEQLVEVARHLRTTHRFSGYIHLKTIPEADPDLLAQAGRYADRLSINIELPDDKSIARLAPEKNGELIRKTMAGLGNKISEAKAERTISRKAPIFAPGGHSTQMIIGADASDDGKILRTSNSLYGKFGLKRVYYSAFSPIPDASRSLPIKAPPLMREHRLYQADWLLRFYGFSVDEIMSGAKTGHLDLSIDPKLAWALQNRAQFPVDINRAEKEKLLRVPGLGTTGVGKILRARRFSALRLRDLENICQSVKKILPFVTLTDWNPGNQLDSLSLYDRLKPPPKQLDLFSS